MPKSKKGCVILTRVAPEDLGQCREIVQSRKQSMSSFAREALLAHVANIVKKRVDGIEGIYATTFKAGVNRICGLLYRIAKHSLATYLFLDRMDHALMQECLATSVKMIRNTLQIDEEEIPEAMSEEIRGVRNEISSKEVVPA